MGAGAYKDANEEDDDSSSLVFSDTEEDDSDTMRRTKRAAPKKKKKASGDSFWDAVARLVRPLFGTKAKVKPPKSLPMTKEQFAKLTTTIGGHIANLEGISNSIKEKRRNYLRKGEAASRASDVSQAAAYNRIAVMFDAVETRTIKQIGAFEQLQALLVTAEVTQITVKTFFKVNRTLKESLTETLKDGQSIDAFGADFEKTMRQMEELTEQLDTYHDAISDAQGTDMPMADDDLLAQVQALGSDETAAAPPPKNPLHASKPPPTVVRTAPAQSKTLKNKQPVGNPRARLLLGEDAD